MYTPNGEEVFVIDGHIDLWDVTEENIVHGGGEQFSQCLYDYHTAFTPEGEQWDVDTYRRYRAERVVQDLFRDGHVDMGIFQPTYLTDFYEEGSTRPIRTPNSRGVYRAVRPLRKLRPKGCRRRNRQPRMPQGRLRHPGCQTYTAEWRGDSKGWRLDSDEAFRFL